MIESQLSLFDSIIIASYLLIIFYIGLIASKKKSPHQNAQTFSDYQFLANRELNIWKASISIIATEVSSLTILGIPAFCFSFNFSLIYFYFGVVIARFFIAFYIVPRIYNRGLTIYSIIGNNFQSESGEKAVTYLYMFNKVLAIGVRLFSGSIIISTFYSISIYWAIILTIITAFVYTSVGGIKAVVNTDVFQFSIFIGAGLVCLFLIPSLDERSIIFYFEQAIVGGKISLQSVDGTLITALISFLGGFLFNIATHGCDQDYAQRLMSSKSVLVGQKAIILSGFITLFIVTLYLTIGAFLWVFYQQNPSPVAINSDYLFSHFIYHEFPFGLRGMMIVAVIAATLSTLDSVMNSIGACIYADIRKDQQDENFEQNYYFDLILISLSLAAVAFIASKYDKMLILGLKVSSWTGGSLLAFVLIGLYPFYFKSIKYSARNLTISYLASITVIYICNIVLALPWELNVYWGFIISLISMLVCSKIIPQAKPLVLKNSNS